MIFCGMMVTFGPNGAPEAHHLPAPNSWVGYFRVGHRMDRKTNQVDADTYAVENVSDAENRGYQLSCRGSKCMIVPWKTALLAMKVSSSSPAARARAWARTRRLWSIRAARCWRARSIWPVQLPQASGSSEVKKSLRGLLRWWKMYSVTADP